MYNTNVTKCNNFEIFNIEKEIFGVDSMKKHGLYIAAVALISGFIMWGTPAQAWADVEEEAVVVSQVIEVNADSSQEMEVEEALEGSEAEALAGEAAGNETADIRQNLVNYALQFVGGRYRAGGNDPHTGVDCSGFVKYVMQNGAGVSMNRSSRAQATQGRQISADQMQPGDLIFYGSGSRINHVAMYIGNGQIVHASTERTGIKTSVWNYRAPVKIVSMLG